MMRVVQASGGIGSWATAHRVTRRHGTDDLVLLFCDTLIEEPSLYRFLDEQAAHLGVPLVRVADGRTPFEVYEQTRFLGNSRIAPCSRILKQLPARRWLTAHADPAHTILYIGIDVHEARRVRAIRAGWAPWRTEFPLLDEPDLSKEDMLHEARALGLTPPDAYVEGFAHANCSGLCVRAGQAHWLRLLRTHPDRFARYERLEAGFRARHGDVAILKQRRNGVSTPLPLAELRRRHSITTHGAGSTVLRGARGPASARADSTRGWRTGTGATM
jgi:hypothetical protein